MAHRELICTLNLHLLGADQGGPARARLDPADDRCRVTDHPDMTR
jgi:hypothetical protein